MKTATALLTAASLASLGFCQSARIGFPTNGTTVTAGQNITVQVDRPDTLTGSTDIAIVLAIAQCPDASSGDSESASAVSSAFTDSASGSFSVPPMISASDSGASASATDATLLSARQVVDESSSASAIPSSIASAFPITDSSFTASGTFSASAVPSSVSSSAPSAGSDGCFPPTSILGTIVHSGPFHPKFDDPSDGRPPHQNFTITIPANIQGAARLNLAHFAVVGAGNFPLLDTAAVEITVLPGDDGTGASSIAVASESAPATEITSSSDASTSDVVPTSV